MKKPNQPSLFGTLSDAPKSASEQQTTELERIDGGYFDALAAIGCAALVEAYYECTSSPLIDWSPTGFRITYSGVLRLMPDLGWLRYSVAGTWRKGDDRTKWKAPAGHTLKATGWDEQSLIPTHGAEIDVSSSPTLDIQVGEHTFTITEPGRQLYGVANKLSQKVDWFNLCVFACRERGLDLIHNRFEEDSVSLNSIVLPQASKGAFSTGAFSIGNASLPDSVVRPLARLTCLAVAGFIVAAQGQAPQKGEQGFAVPVPQRMPFDVLRQISSDNRRRIVSKGVFFAYDNYLSFLKLLLTYIEDHKTPGEDAVLRSVAGARFISLGNSSSPAGSWQLAVPEHHYTVSSVERLKNLLIDWKRKAKAGNSGTVSVDRTAVARLVQGFSESEPTPAAEGYLSYVFTTSLTGRKGPFYSLTQSFFEEIMDYKPNYRDLLNELRGDDIKPFIDLVRRETYNAAFPLKGQPATQPNYQMMRRLREVQNTEDFVQAVAEIAIERGMTKVATARSDNAKTKQWGNPYEPSLTRLIELAESGTHSPRMIAQLILALALCKRPNEQAEGEDDAAQQALQEEAKEASE